MLWEAHPPLLCVPCTLWRAHCASVTGVLPCTQELSACLTLVASSLASLLIHSCEGVFTSKSLRTLWVAPRLKRLVLIGCEFAIDMEDFNRGVKELRCMA